MIASQRLIGIPSGASRSKQFSWGRQRSIPERSRPSEGLRALGTQRAMKCRQRRGTNCLSAQAIRALPSDGPGACRRRAAGLFRAPSLFADTATLCRGVSPMHDHTQVPHMRVAPSRKPTASAHAQRRGQLSLGAQTWVSFVRWRLNSLPVVFLPARGWSRLKRQGRLKADEA